MNMLFILTKEHVFYNSIFMLSNFIYDFLIMKLLLLVVMVIGLSGVQFGL